MRTIILKVRVHKIVYVCALGHNYCKLLYIGGLGEAVAGAVSGERGIALRRLNVLEIPRSGPGAALMDMFGISAPHIVKAVKEMIAA